MRAQTMMAIPLLLAAGCIQDLLDAGAALSPDSDTTESSSSTSTGDPPAPTTSAGSGVQTVTSLPGETDGPATTGEPESTGAPAENEPPTIALFDASPNSLSEAGKALIQLETSMDAIKARLFLNGVELAELAPADFPYTYEALSAKDNGTPHVFTVVVEDAEGLTAMAETKLTVQLPPSGAQKCLFTETTSASSVISALLYTETAIIAAGARDTGDGYKATLWKLDPDHCEEALPGWPKTLSDWTADPALAALPSRASAIAVDEFGNLAVGINLTKDGKPQRYVTFLTPDGARLWEKPGKVGEELAGITIAPGTVVAVGWVRTSENPVRTDAMVWRHLEGGGVWSEPLKAPFTPDEPFPDLMNLRSEWARAVLYDPKTELLLVVGDREFKADAFNIVRRTFITRFVPLGGRYGDPWTSPGDPLPHDGGNTIGFCGDDIILGGWTQDWSVDALQQPLTRWLDADGIPAQRVPELLSGAQSFGVACDREGKLVSAAMRSSGQLDAQVFAFAEPAAPRLWYEIGAPGNDGAGTLDCDTRGFCAWGGFRTLNGKSIAVVRVHHP